MVKLNRIYTKTGDDGTTGLVRGPRRPKYDLRVEAYGTIDEANACIGQARIHSGAQPKIDKLLNRIQNDLFDVGSDLAIPGADTDDAPYPVLRIRPIQTEALEKLIDQYNAAIEPLTSFVLPGGSPLAAALHVARTVTRRAERITAELAVVEPDTSPEALRYLNRLSDLLFVLSRVANANGATDVLWVPGNNGDLKKP
ncbi:MAG: cob(I)yrinic acid a,c-diamide adenosyltransferase [Candidatus Devosia symbiotica]|nr:cob(I)yrinic acid a,c-diamide adenosyltransferase [Candidatus Devosia symbiotica]